MSSAVAAMPRSYRRAAAVAPRARERSVTEGSVVVVFGVAEVPLQEDVLALGVSHHTLTVAAELRVVRRQQHEPGHDPGAEVLDHLAIAEVGLHLPVRSHRPEVDDTGVTAGRLDFGSGDI